MQEELIELQNDRNLKSSFEYNTNLEEFWCKNLWDIQIFGKQHCVSS
jgi:hypothetical protein